mgnify:CR=1 FL=1
MRNKVRYLVLVIAILMIIVQAFNTDFSDFFKWEKVLPFIALICIIIAMAGSIIYVCKQKRRQ